MSFENLHNKRLGTRAELLAINIYQKKGWIKEALNHRTRNSELDIVMRDVSGETLLFVEVKAIEIGNGLNLNNLKPEDNFTRGKQIAFKRGIEKYIASSNNHNKNIRIDLACVVHDTSMFGETGEWRIKIYENIILD